METKKYYYIAGAILVLVLMCFWSSASNRKDDDLSANNEYDYEYDNTIQEYEYSKTNEIMASESDFKQQVVETLKDDLYATSFLNQLKSAVIMTGASCYSIDMTRVSNVSCSIDYDENLVTVTVKGTFWAYDEYGNTLGKYNYDAEFVNDSEYLNHMEWNADKVRVEET